MFLTNLSIRFTKDLKAADFSGADVLERQYNLLQGDSNADRERREQEAAARARVMQDYGISVSGATESDEKIPGFVVQIVGYSPYGKDKTELYEIIDPDVKDESDKWGFLTRLDNLDEFTNSNGSFELYQKGDSEQCDVEIREIDLDEGVPPEGIGVQDTRTIITSGSKQNEIIEAILIDPLTKEIISKVTELDENGQEKYYSGRIVQQTNDHWFVINLKLKWKDAPESLVSESTF